MHGSHHELFLQLISATSKSFLERNPEATKIKILLLVLADSFLVLDWFDWELDLFEGYLFGGFFEVKMFPMLDFVPD